MSWTRGSNSGTAGGGDTVSNTASSGSSSQTTNSSSTTTQNSSSQTAGSKSVQNMTPESLASLQVLIAQLMAGGTPEQRAESAQREYEINAARTLRQGYSKEAAFADAQGAQAAQMRQAMEQLLPSIVRAAEGAGASQSSMRALLLNDAQQRAADSSALLGLQAATNYGNISSNVTGILEALTRQDSSVTNALLQALQISKGAVENSQWAESQSGSSTTNQSGTSTTTGNTSQQQTASTGQRTGGTPSTQSASYTGPVMQSPTQLSDAAWSQLMKSTGSNNASELASYIGQRGGWSNYQF